MPDFMAPFASEDAHSSIRQSPVPYRAVIDHNNETQNI